MTNGKEAFGIPQRHRPVVPAFDDMLEAAREVVNAIAWLRREISKQQMLCDNVQQVITEMEISTVAPDACAHVSAAAQRMRATIHKAHEFCARLEALTIELSPSDITEEAVTMPRILQLGKGDQ